MNLKDIFAEYATKQRELVLKAYLSSKYFDEEDAILNAPEPPLPEIPVIRWVKALGQEPPDGVCLPLKINGQYDFGFANHYTKRFICTRSLEPIPYRKVEWLFDPSRADLYMILPGVK